MCGQFTENDTLEDASTLMIKENFSGIPVMDSTNNITGIITKTDLMNFIVDLEEVR